MKFGQLIKYNMRNIFLEKTVDKMWWRNFSQTLFQKIKIGHTSESIVLNSIQFIFIVYQIGDYQNKLKLSSRPLAFASYKTFLKNKKSSGTSLLVSFSAWFLRKNVSVFIFYYLTKLHCLVAFTSWSTGQFVYCSCLTRLWRHKFWN